MKTIMPTASQRGFELVVSKDRVEKESKKTIQKKQTSFRCIIVKLL